LRGGKPFLSRAPYEPTPATSAAQQQQQQQAANIIPLPIPAAAQATVFGSTGGAQVMAISLSNSFPGFSDARFVEGLAGCGERHGKVPRGKNRRSTLCLIFHLLLYLISRR
jgi:hypothetical protein